MKRQLIITDAISKRRYALQFDSEKTTDSDAFHAFLCEINPEENYTVTFTSKESDMLPLERLYMEIF